jgi:S1-C subfamily serine protease
MSDDMGMEGMDRPSGAEPGPSGDPTHQMPLWPDAHQPTPAGLPFPPRPDVPARPDLGSEWPDAPRRRSPLTIVLAAVMACLILLGGGIGIGSLLHRGDGAVTGVSSSAGNSFADTTGIVDVNTFTTRTGLHVGTDFPLGAGTGMIITPSGQVLTNNHVIEGATRIQVTIPGGNIYQAQVLGADPTDDVALLQLEGAQGLKTVTVADSSTVEVSDSVVAIGNALGRGGAPSISKGSVGGLDQTIQVRGVRGHVDELDGVIQVLTSVSPGDSGGPLENEQGDVVGMITAADAHKGASPSTVAFAVPSNAAIDIVRRIRLGESSEAIVIGDAGYLGVRVADVTAASGSPLGVSPGDGAFVQSVMPGSPAADIGMRGNSVITAIDGTAISTADDLGPAIHQHAPGERIDVTWVDTAGTHTASASLVPGPAV